MKRAMLVVVSGLALAFSAGCQTRREMLENVAKDWCETIRASQIIPVYPLTEDLQPGDVFLVQMSTANQASLYRRRGFLPLDDHRTRLKFDNEAFEKMYFPSYWSDDFGAELPHTRPLRPGTPAPNPEPQPGTPPPAEIKVPPTLSEAAAPRAAFPSYSFEVSTSSGLSLALPLQGVPTALGFLNTTRATGSVTIADARTYGVDSREAHQGMIDWASDPQIRSQLAAAVKNNNGEPLYLRVITRVYLTGAVNVTMSRSVSTGADLAAGKAPDVDLIKPDGNVNENNAKAIDALNNNKATPVATAVDAGGRVKFVGASSSSVSMVESFDRLLVIGYVGLDVPVFKGGVLGFPVPTFQRLEGLADAPMQPALELTSTELGIKARVRLVTGGVLKKAGSDAITPTAAAEERLRAANVMHDTLAELSTPDSSGLHSSATDAVNAYLVIAAPAEGRPAAEPAVERESFRVAAEAFRTWALSFIGEDGAAESLDARFQAAFDTAYGKQFEEN